MANTKIQWTNRTWNPVIGCSKVSAGCKNCYAIKQSYRCEAMGAKVYEGITKFQGDGRNFTGLVKCLPERLEQPLHWKQSMVFVNSMSDLFHESVPVEYICRVFNIMASALPECGKRHEHEEECWTGDPHIYQILTKRPERMLRVINKDMPDELDNNFPGDCNANMLREFGQWPLVNVWLGVTAENQEMADQRIPLLLQTPAAVRFISVEPMLGPVNLFDRAFSVIDRHGEPSSPRCNDDGSNAISWVICGAESGPGARPMETEWARDLLAQCREAGVPFFMKQLCERGKKIQFEEFPADLQVREYPHG